MENIFLSKVVKTNSSNVQEKCIHTVKAVHMYGHPSM